MACRILVVDDEKFIVEAISQHLEHLGYDVTSFTDSKEAIAAIAQEDYDLVMTDLRMPEISGMDIARAVNEKNTDSLVIILTGYATLDSAIESVHLQIYAYLNKPFDLRQLGQVVDQALMQQRLKRENDILQKRISQMLGDITTIYKVTKLLYDSDDWDMTLEFVLETLSIGFNISHSCIVLKNPDGEFAIGKVICPAKSKLPGQLRQVAWSKFEEQGIVDDPVFISAKDKLFKFVEPLGNSKEQLTAIHLIPISYREELCGYLVTFQFEGAARYGENMQLLLQILTTQIAPQIYQPNGSGPGSESEPLQYSDVGIQFLNQQLHRIPDESGSASVGLIRFSTPNDLTEPAEADSFKKFCQAIIHRHCEDSVVQWAGADTALVFIPESNQGKFEISGMAVSEEYTRSVQDSKANAKVVFASSTWPQDGMEAYEVYGLVWSRLISKQQALFLSSEDGSAEDE